MAVVSINEQFGERTGAYTTDVGRSYVRVFLVVTNNQYDGPNVAIQSVGIQRGDQYIILESDGGLESDTNAYAHTITASQEEGDSLGWKVIVEYGPYSALWAGGGPSQNPLLQPIDVSMTLRSQEIVIDQDINGNPIVNTAFDPFDPPLMEDDPRWVLTVVRNEAQPPIPLMFQYRNAVNSDQFAGQNPLMVRVLNISPKSIFHQDVGWYTQMTYEFEIRPPTSANAGQNGYRRTVLNQGMRALSVVSGTKFHPSYKGIPITEPVLLTKTGTVINTGQNPYYLIFQTKPELPFSIFMFDQLALTFQRSGFNTGYGPPFYPPPG